GPQVGISLRLFVFDDGQTGPTFVANPELLDPSDTVEEEEGCLSIPGPYHLTPRSARIRCRGQDAKGKDVEMEGEGLLARIFQHETDHLEGLLYIDRLDEAGRPRVLGRSPPVGAGAAGAARAAASGMNRRLSCRA